MGAMADHIPSSEPLRWRDTPGDPPGSRFTAAMLMGGSYSMHFEARRVTFAEHGSPVAEVYPEDLEAVQSFDVESRFRTASGAELGLPAQFGADRYVVFAYPFGE